jgi:hypothetical protein
MADHTITVTLSPLDEELTLKLINDSIDMDNYLISIIQDKMANNRDSLFNRIPQEIKDLERGLPLLSKKKTIAIAKTIIGLANTYLP